MLRRLTSAAAVAAATVVVAAAPVAADPAGRISSIGVDEGQVTLTFAGVDLPEGTVIDPASVEVSLDGTTVDSAAEPVTEVAEIPPRTVVLSMDTSGSMADDGKIEAAREAATGFVDAIPADVAVGLVSFAAEPTLLVEPTQDRQPVRDAIAGLEPEGDTALYDGVLTATAATGSEGIRTVLVLSDGEDTISAADLESTVVGVRESGVQVDAVALGAGAEDAVSALTQITAAGGGTVVQAADAPALASFFEVAAAAITNELLVSATLPADFTALDATLEVTGQAGDTTVSDSAFISVAASGESAVRDAPAEDFGPIAVASPDPLLTSTQRTWALWGGLAALGLGAAVVFGFAFVRLARDEDTSVRGRLSLYSLTDSRPRLTQEEVTTALGGSAVARSAVELADRVVQERRYDEDLAIRLDAAGLPLRPAEWVLIQAASTLGLGLLGLLVSGFNVWVAIAAVLVGFFVPFFYLRAKASRRRRRFNTQLPDSLQLMASSLEAGYSMPQAVDTVAREDLDPLSGEFNRALVESRLGVPIEDGLDGIVERMQSQDFSWVVMAIRIQRQVGGSLANVLKTVAETLRERERLRRTVRALSADGRLSAWIIGFAPFFAAAFLLIFRPGYINPLFERTAGWVLIGVALVLIAIGVVIIRRIIRIEL